MDAVSSFNNQWKEREVKVYSQKAEVHVKEMKEVTSMPKIDPLSRKVAEIVTRRELEMLGIPIVESSSKKPLITQRSSRIIKPGIKQISADFTAKDVVRDEIQGKDHQVNPIRKEEINTITHQRQKHKTKNFSDIPTDQSENTHSQEPYKKIILNDLAPQIEKPKAPKTPKITICPTDLGKIIETVEKIQENRKIHEEMLNNVEHLKAFREELHRDYPELGLDNSVVGSSFHTNELNELEEACKDMTPDQMDMKSPQSKESEDQKFNMFPINQMTQENLETEDEKKIDFLQELKKINMEELSNMSECGSSSCIEKPSDKKDTINLEINVPVLTENIPSDHTKQTSEQRESATLSIKSKAIRTPTYSGSKFQSIYSHEAPSKEFASLYSSYYKSSFLHLPQELIPSTVPRCHINLATCKSSPIFQSVRVGRHSRIKCDNGIALADSLRRELLKPPKALPDKEPKNFYEKNLVWLNKKDEKTKKIRESLTEREIKDCTFEPFVSKNPVRKAQKSMDYKPVTGKSKSSLDLKDMEMKSHTRMLTELTPRGLDNITIYSALSPTGSKVGFSEGCAVGRLLEKSKPMVNYRSVNFLN